MVFSGMLNSMETVPRGDQSVMETLFRKATQNRVFQDVVSQIQTAILNGKLKVGEKLPPERELGEMLGTSRGTLREALRILEQKGLIEIKLGVNGGAVVKAATSEHMSESLALLIQSQVVSLEELSEFREGVEGIVTGLAAERITDNDIEGLQALREQATEIHQKGLAAWDDFVGVDEQIHMQLARISGNLLYRFILETVHDNIHRYYDKYLKVSEREMEENYSDLCNIIEAVINRRPEEAAELARVHVNRFKQYMDRKKRLT